MPGKQESGGELAKASELVGQFNYHFARLEGKINSAIAELFKLDTNSADVLTANIDFARKVYIVRSAVEQQNASPQEKWLTDEISEAFKKIFAINNERLIVAHSPFEPNGTDGVKFIRVTARDKLQRKEIVWTKTDFSDRFTQMLNLDRELDNVLRHIQPYVPKLDFSDSRNSMYFPLLT